MNLREFLATSGIFDERWYRESCGLVDAELDAIDHWIQHGRPSRRGPNAMIDGLRPGSSGATAGGDGPAWSVDAEIAYLRDSGLFDSEYYLSHHSVPAAREDPLAHYCHHGWKELRAPRADFDVWWYWCTYLDPRREAMNPLLHFALFGDTGTLPGPQQQELGAGVAYLPGQRPSRICLFAGYDPDGVVDDCVVAYVRELARHAEVYYLADCAIRPGELDKLAPYVKGAWAQRHGAYDFGSWSKLATELVGWEEIDRHDELLLVNDSCYLLRELDGVFAQMDARRCDWWGLQATKRGFGGIGQSRSALPFEQLHEHGLLGLHGEYVDNLHLSSYVLVLRRLVVQDPGFRLRLESVVPQLQKTNVIRKYEVGLSRYLMTSGFRFDTFADGLYPYHPVYTDTVFDLIAKGFPVFKRLMLTQNPRLAPNLHAWKERLLSLVPDADVEAMERNLLRVADNEKLYRNLRVTLDAEGFPEVPEPLDDARMARLDQETPKFDHWWAFPVCAFDHSFAGNERAVFEEVKDDPSIKKIVLTRKKHIKVDGESVVVVPLNSPEGQYHLLRAKQIFVKHSPSINARYSLSPERHNFINLWHGIPLKRFGYASLDMVDKLGWVHKENGKCRAVISSSKMDTLAMAAAFYPLSCREIWTTGLPRNDFILRSEDRLPNDFREQERQLRQWVGGRRLVLFCPTFRNSQEDGYYRFSEEELAFLKEWQVRNNAVLGVREHMADRARAYSAMLAPLGVLDLSSAPYPNIEVLYRVAAALVTDYSSCAIDFMLTGRPVISFAYDYDNYANNEHGFFYELDHVLPGPVCRDFAQLAKALDNVFDDVGAGAGEVYEWKRKLFFDNLDDQNSWRVVRSVMNFYVAACVAGKGEGRCQTDIRSDDQIAAP